MINLIKRNYFCLSVYLFVIGSCFLLNHIYGKKLIHLAVNKYHCFATDLLFKYITHIGDGFFAVIVILMMLFNRLRNALMLLFAFLLSGLFTQILKRTIFKGTPRPVPFFKDIAELYLVDGVQIMHSNTFPSGHSATVFALAFCFIFTANKIHQQYIFFITALLVSFSRVYLSEHFLIDIIAGSLIGVIAAFIAYFSIKNLKLKLLDNQLRISLYNTTEKKLNESN